MTVELPPPINDLEYDDLVAEAKARIPVHNPDWTNYNDADPGITLLQLFAFMADSISYRANLIPERNRRAFLRLLGLQQRGAVPAEGLVAFDGTKGPLASYVIPADAEVAAGNVPFRTEHAIDVLPLSAIACAKVPSASTLDAAQRAAYLSMYQDLDEAAEDVQFYDTQRLTLPAGGTRYRPVSIAKTVDHSLWIALLAPKREMVDKVCDHIGGKVLSLGIVPDVVDASRILPPASVLRSVPAPRLMVSAPTGVLSSDPEATRVAAYRELDTDEHGDILVEPGILDVVLPAPDELVAWGELEASEDGYGDFPPPLEPDERARVVTWLRLTRVRSTSVGEVSGALDATFSWVGVNVAGIAQVGRTADEWLPSGTGESEQMAHLGQRSVLVESVRLTVDGTEWSRVDDLRTAPPETVVGAGVTPDRPGIASGSTPYVFACEPDGTVRFGDGLRGARPPRGAEIRASYSSSMGYAGVLPADAIKTVLGQPPGVQVTNPIPTWGGQDAETVEDAEARMAEIVHHRDRLVTQEDIREIAWRVPGVDLGRVEVLPLFHPLLVGIESPGVITVMVMPRFDPVQPEAPRPDQMFLDSVCEHLDRRRLVTTEIHVVGPKYVDLSLAIGFDPVAGRDVPEVREQIKTTVRAFLSPLDLVPGDGYQGWPLGKAVDPLEVLTVVARVGGVARVNGVRLSRPDGTPVVGSLTMAGLELPHLVGLAVQPGDPPTGADSGPPPTRLLPVPAIPEEC